MYLYNSAQTYFIKNSNFEKCLRLWRGTKS